MSIFFSDELLPPRSEDKIFDVIIVGYGVAGASAAIEAADNGASVLVLEKTSQGGGNSVLSSGGFIIPSDVRRYAKYLQVLSESSRDEFDPLTIEQFAIKSLELEEWLHKLFPQEKLYDFGIANYLHIEGHESVRKYTLKKSPNAGQFLFDLLDSAVKKRPHITVKTNARVRSLIKKNNTIEGLIYQSGGYHTQVLATKGIILACGGFEFDDSTLNSIFPGIVFSRFGHTGNTGDGIRMAKDVGADIWHMKAISCGFGIKVPSLISPLLFWTKTPRYIWINQYGKRFINETSIDFHSALYAVKDFDPSLQAYPKIPCFFIMDEKARLSGTFVNKSFGLSAKVSPYEWSKHSEKEISNGVLNKGNSLEELAKAINVPPKNLKETVEKWNKDIEQGHDSLFGRPISSVYNGNKIISAAPITTPPYYAIALWPTIMNTQGGPRRDCKSRVLDCSGQPIKHLYSAGELGSIWSKNYQGSTNLSEALVFGRIAGKNAATQI